MSMLKEFKAVMKIVMGVMEESKDFDFELYLAMVSMMLEERCRVEGKGMVETCERLLDAAKLVNKTMGKYE